MSSAPRQIHNSWHGYHVLQKRREDELFKKGVYPVGVEMQLRVSSRTPASISDNSGVWSRPTPLRD